MFTYIKRNVSKIYVTLEEQLNPEEYNNLGSTYADFLDNKWVLLSEEQVNFHNEHPEASVREVFNMEINKPVEHVRTAEDAKHEKLRDIDIYDNSEAVNSFTINETITAWFTPQERSNYKNSVESAKLLGVKELSLFVNDSLITIPTEKAELVLASIQLYADACYIATQQHKSIINNMTEIEDIDNYDFTVGYPERINFTI